VNEGTNEYPQMIRHDMIGYLLLQLGHHPVAVVKYRKETTQNEKQYTKQYKNNTKSKKSMEQTTKIQNKKPT
jgi:hypothetical protein